MFTLEKLSPFLIKSTVDAFEADEDLFDSVLASAISMVKTETGITDDDDIDDTYLLPTAWIMNYIFINTYQTINSDDFRRHEKLYESALTLLKPKTVTGTDRIGEIEGLFL